MVRARVVLGAFAVGALCPLAAPAAAAPSDQPGGTSAVTEELDAALGEVDRQLARLQQEQVEVNTRTAANWQAYVGKLAAAGVAVPPAAGLRNSPDGLPPGMVPVAASDGGAQRGAAQVPRRPSSLLVLPSETLAAVTAAMEQLGLPYAPGTAGPESWACGSLVQSVFGSAGIALPGDQATLFAETAPVAPADVLPGDLVFLGTADGRLAHVDIALDPRTMLAADARAGAVVVRTLPTEHVLGIGRRVSGSAPPSPRRSPGAAHSGWSAGTPSTRRASTARGPGAGIQTA